MGNKDGIEMEKTVAIVLAAGLGKRMHSSTQKQFLLLKGYPVLYYSLKAFEESEVDQIILVTGQSELEYCRKEIVGRYGFRKVAAIVAGGKERYHSVYEGLRAASCLYREKNQMEAQHSSVQEELPLQDREGAFPDYVLIHDGARPFVTPEIITRTLMGAKAYGACVAGMPVKDTIRMLDEEDFSEFTPDRSRVWMMQTPQTFSFPLIYDAYQCLIRLEKSGRAVSVTDDAMVLECMTGKRVKLTEGSYENIKITTPSDLLTAEAFLRSKGNGIS